MSTPEEIKLASHNLRGDLPSEVHNASPDFSHDSRSCSNSTASTSRTTAMSAAP